MDEEGFLDSSRPAGDPVGGGSHRRSRSGGDWVDNEGAMGRGHVRPNMGLDLGSGFGAADAQAGQGSSRKRVGIDARRSDTVNLDDEGDGLIRNGSATREAPFKDQRHTSCVEPWPQARRRISLSVLQHEEFWRRCNPLQRASWQDSR